MYCIKCGQEFNSVKETICPACRSSNDQKTKKFNFDSKKKLILIGSILCLFSLLMTWGSDSRTSSLYFSNEKTMHHLDGSFAYTYLEPEVIQNKYDNDVQGSELFGGFGSAIALVFIILSFININKKLPKYLNYFPSLGYLLLIIIFIDGIIKYGLSFGIILYLISLILIYKGSRNLDIWRPQFVEKILRRKSSSQN